MSLNTLEWWQKRQYAVNYYQIAMEVSNLERYGAKHCVINVDEGEIRIYPISTSGVSQFSPFALDQVKPVAKVPSKWTVAHLRKILANGQFRRYRQDYYYTDDFAQDAADNYRQGYIQNPLSSFADALVSTSMTVFSRQEDDGTVSLHFGEHLNDGRSLIVELDNRYPLIDLPEEESLFLKGDIPLLDVA